jgi:hypothetical protein
VLLEQAEEVGARQQQAARVLDGHGRCRERTSFVCGDGAERIADAKDHVTARVVPHARDSGQVAAIVGTDSTEERAAAYGFVDRHASPMITNASACRRAISDLDIHHAGSRYRRL